MRCCAVCRMPAEPAALYPATAVLTHRWPTVKIIVAELIECEN